jgi:hypothetical protein
MAAFINILKFLISIQKLYNMQSKESKVKEDNQDKTTAG